MIVACPMTSVGDDECQNVFMESADNDVETLRRPVDRKWATRLGIVSRRFPSFHLWVIQVSFSGVQFPDW